MQDGQVGIYRSDCEVMGRGGWCGGWCGVGGEQWE